MADDDVAEVIKRYQTLLEAKMKPALAAAESRLEHIHGALVEVDSARSVLARLRAHQSSDSLETASRLSAAALGVGVETPPSLASDVAPSDVVAVDVGGGIQVPALAPLADLRSFFVPIGCGVIAELQIPEAEVFLGQRRLLLLDRAATARLDVERIREDVENTSSALHRLQHLSIAAEVEAEAAASAAATGPAATGRPRERREHEQDLGGMSDVRRRALQMAGGAVGAVGKAR